MGDFTLKYLTALISALRYDVVFGKRAIRFDSFYDTQRLLKTIFFYQIKYRLLFVRFFFHIFIYNL